VREQPQSLLVGAHRAVDPRLQGRQVRGGLPGGLLGLRCRFGACGSGRQAPYQQDASQHQHDAARGGHALTSAQRRAALMAPPGDGARVGGMASHRVRAVTGGMQA
jgi:hypothetical protein